jgi:hypothetical protein
MDVTRPTTRVTIDRLVLDGVDAGDPLIAQAVRRALGPAMQATSPAAAAQTAEAVARAIEERAQ